jgi:hypothetical protein
MRNVRHKITKEEKFDKMITDSFDTSNALLVDETIDNPESSNENSPATNLSKADVL